MDEFALIRQHFAALAPGGEAVLLGIGDDCALLQPPPGEALAVTTDTLIAGRHFPVSTASADIGWKSLAASLSDLAAMGAAPLGFVLALSLPEPDSTWLAGFASGLGALAHQAGIPLVGGDTTRGSLSITITAFGRVPAGKALRRSGARPGDRVCVTGTLGDAALALQRLAIANDAEDGWLRARLDRPQPRLAAGLALRELATAALDLSDGLVGDLAHLLHASACGARIEAARLPMSPAFERLTQADQRLALQAAGGDDYELCVCIPAARLAAARAALDLPLSVIGEITAEPGLRWIDTCGQVFEPGLRGYRHFG